MSSPQPSTSIAYMIVAMVMYPITSIWTAWWFMLALGAAHSDITSAVPALGYWASYVLTVGACMLSVVVRGVLGFGSRK